ncbi:GTPase ObgE [Streptococcus agalactiae]|uniref:GTPase ObgE n=1 Tax=Streptococcus agalactiae TaxID=1311 RepID=UPI00005C84C5|nr:GTPase ObgE [Streptococcus agalactiae]EAO78976.1 GTP-binding protein, GTP1/Obg family [Streptococcus agalactiae H36B]EPW73720.1 GTPase CgtA [Streptococcus agalactiae BSU133]KLL22729.1 GTPase CgtA [Streptococcus agalactiae]CCQ82838.1 GTPase ObgE [Streptococcus agalactiae SS1014]SQG26762.1 GTP-binding protein Obg [Streptococcus agalactiae]
MSMFLDTAKISVKAGRGGDGMVAFRREKYVPNGGPWGGDGGKGGSVIFKVNEGLRTLMDFRYNRNFKAKAGEKGMTKGMHGRGAEDLIVSLPPGTTVRDATTGKVITDLVEHDQEFVVARGGRGGRGNIRFATPRNPAPEIAEKGEPGEERELQLELKILADVGLVGFPSVGKSTLLSVVSAAKPKIGAYHFTTIVPNLGMVRTKSGDSFAMADLPGLIEGASQGVGLGTQFLRHIERTRVILHVIDMSASEGRDPYDDYVSINNELETYNLRLMERPQIIVANKMDMPDSEENLAAFKEKLAANYDEFDDMPMIFPISSLAHQGLENLMDATAELLANTEEFLLYDETDMQEDEAYYGFNEDERPFEITRDDDATWVLYGDKLEKLFVMTNMERDESIMKFARQLRGMGVDEALRERGAKDGDIVRIGNFEFEFVD